MEDGASSQGCLLTKKGRRTFEWAAAWFGWVLGVLTVLGAVLAESNAARSIGFLIVFAASTWTVTLAVRRQADVVRAAYEIGKAEGATGVRPLR